MATTQIRGANAGTGTSQVKPATLSNADIHASAAIALSKLEEAVIQADGGQAFTADQPLGGFKLTGVGDPTAAQDAATKAYVDATASGLDVHKSVRASTTAALNTVDVAGSGVGKTLTKNTNGSINSEAVDGVTLIVGDRLLVKNQADTVDNGVYTVTTVGSGSVKFVLTRATDFDQDAEVTAGAFFFIEEGTTLADTGWVLNTNNPITVDTTGLAFTQFSSAGIVIAGDGLVKTGLTIDIVVDSSLTVTADLLRVAYLFATRETPSGTVNGSNVTFTLANTPVSGSDEVYLNGLIQDSGGGNDYTISGATITFATAPQSGDKIRCSYRYAS